MRERELILYRNFGQADLLYDMAWVMEHYADETAEREKMAGMLYDCMHRLVELAESHGFYGNLWHCYLADLLANHENSYSRACEIVGHVAGTVNELALHDFAIMKEFYDYDFHPVTEALQVKAFYHLLDYSSGETSGRIYNKRIRNRICELAKRLADAGTPEEMKEAMTEFYREYGVGRFGLHKAFRVVRRQESVEIRPIPNIAHVRLEDLVGYEIPKRKLIENTEAFVEGRKANNCLLFGDSGTGKSTSIKAIVNAYYDRGLRMIEIYRHQFQDLNEVIAQIKNRNYKFIIYMDDLSFEEFETEYKYLKAVIEGGLERKPENVLIYATSNRRHLVRERFSDREEKKDDLHNSDTVQEKLSLAARFGVTIYFGSPDRREFQNIVKALAERNHISLPKDRLLAEAGQWELAHGGLSGRTAQQFIDYLLGKKRGYEDE